MFDRGSFDLPRTLLQVLAIGALIVGTLWIAQPFLASLAWASTIVVATWPVLLRAESLFGGRRGPAAAMMTLMLLLVLIAPLSYGIDALIGNAEHFVEWSKSLSTLSVPPPPAWVEALPLVGARIARRWRDIAVLSPDQLAASLAPYAQGVAVWLLQGVGSVGVLVIQFLLTVLISALLYVNGETAARGVCRFAHRLAEDRGDEAVHLAAQAIRGVALGVVVTAIVQTLLVSIGLLAAQVPFAPVLIAATFVLCIAQIGPFPVLIPSVIWVYSQAGTAIGSVFLAWAVISGIVDNILRPVLIRRGADLPLLLIFAGVIGGLIAMGVIGLFLGPVVLAVAYRLLAEWVGDEDRPASVV
jgi:predicted PurR-regulated permease PerM